MREEHVRTCLLCYVAELDRERFLSSGLEKRRIPLWRLWVVVVKEEWFLFRMRDDLIWIAD